MRRPVVYVIGALTGLALGLNWPVMAVGVELLPPLWLASARLTGGGVVLGVGLALLGRLRRPQRRDYPVMATIMIVRLGMVSAFVFLGLLFVPPGRSSVLVYSSVLWAAPLGRWLLKERVTRLRQAGVVAGLMGVIVLVSPWRLDFSDQDLIIGYLFLFGAAVSQAIGAIHVRGHRWAVSPLSLMPWQLTGAGILMAGVAWLLEGPIAVDPGWLELGVVGYQAVFGSAFGFWGVLTVSRNLPAVSSQLLLMCTPVIGVISSVVFVDESLTPALIVGMLLIFLGVGASIVADRRGTQRPPEPDLP